MLNGDTRALIHQLEAQVPKWISVEESKPEPNHNVLLHYSNGRIEGGLFLTSLQQFTCEGLYGEATHWMPLPTPPKGE